MKFALAALAFMAIGGAASAQSAPDCASAHGKEQAAAQTRAALASLSAAMDRQQAALETALRDAATRAQWSEQDRAAFMQRVLRSTPNRDLDRQIGLLTAELRAMLQTSQRGEIKGVDADCRHVARVRQLVGRLESAYARQSDYLTGQLRIVKSVRLPY